MKYLIIVDMQNDFLDGPLGNDHCRKAIPEVCKLIETGTWDEVFLTRDTHFDNYEKTLEGQKLPVRHCIFETNGWDINQEIQKSLNSPNIWEFVVNKPTFGSFQLLEEIQERIKNYIGDSNLEIRFGTTGENLEFHVCGVCTSICVLANVVLLRAKFPDARIIVHADACGDVTREMHKAALVCFKSQQCEVEGE